MDRPENPPMTREQRMSWLANIKDGDWLYYEFELSQVDDNGVTNGAIYTGCGLSRMRNDYSCELQPLDMRIKRMSDDFKLSWRMVGELKCNSLNMPDLHRLWVARWVEFCNGDRPRADAGKWTCDSYRALREAVEQMNTGPAIEGVRIFGR